MKIIKSLIIVILFIIVNYMFLRKVPIGLIIPIVGGEAGFFIGIGGIFFSKTMNDLGINFNRKQYMSFFFGGLFLLGMSFVRYWLNIV